MAPPAVAARGGWTQYGERRLTNMGMPAHIKCNVCKKAKPSATCFSKAQQQLLLDHMKSARGFNANRDAFAVCTGCTQQQVQELTCHTCEKTKGLDRFSKAQRRNPDKAECWTCQEDRQNYEPNGTSDSSSSGGGGSDYDDSDGEPYTLSSTLDGGASLPSDMDNLSMGGPGTYGTRSSTSGSTGGVGLGGAGTYASATTSGYGSTAGARSYGTSSNIPSASSTSVKSSAASVTSSSAASNRTVTGKTGFNPNAYGDPGRRAPPSEAGSYRSAPSTNGNGKWAKVKTVPRKTVYTVAQEERRENKQRSSDVEDDEHQWGAAKDSSDEE